jgi:hypothetical protein
MREGLRKEMKRMIRDVKQAVVIETRGKGKAIPLQTWKGP